MDVLRYLSSLFQKCIRVWKVMRKPSKEEFIAVSKVSAIGTLIIGALGFLIAVVMKFIVR